MGLYLTGGWDEALERIDADVLDDVDSFYGIVIRGQISLARGADWGPDLSDGSRLAEEDLALSSFRKATMARLAQLSGESDVRDLVVESTELMYRQAGIFDDFTMLFHCVTEVAWDAGDRAALDDLLGLVAQDRYNKRPTGLRAQQARMLGLMAIQDGADPATVELHLGTAIAECRAWKSPITLARCQADLGAWLTRQGRPEEAGPLLAEARATFDRLGRPPGRSDSTRPSRGWAPELRRPGEPLDQRESLRGPRQLLVPAAYGVSEVLARIGPLGSIHRLGDGHAPSGQVADRLGDHPDRGALLLHEVAVDRCAVAGDHHRARAHQVEHQVERERPLHRVAVVAVRRHSRLLDQVTGQQHVRIVEPYDEVAAGVATTRVHQLDRPVAEVDRHHRGERRVRGHDRRLGDLLDPAGRTPSAPSAARAHPRRPCWRRRSRAR